MSVAERVGELVETLSMKAHPEGGFYSETYRAEAEIETKNGKRQLITSIYFLLRSEDVSHFHRIKSDELWFWHEGSSLSIHLLGENGHEILKLGPVGEAETFPQHLVGTNTIFGSSVDQPDSYSLVSCVVAPGFDFRDFELFSFKTLILQFPDFENIVRRLT